MQRHYTLRPSRRLILLLATLCILSLLILGNLARLQYFVIGSMLAISCILLYVLMRDASLRLRHSCVAIRLEEEDKIVLVLRDGRHLSGRLLQNSLVTPHMVLLNIALADRRGRRSLLILPDGMKTEAFRRLRVALRWGRCGTKLDGRGQDGWGGVR